MHIALAVQSYAYIRIILRQMVLTYGFRLKGRLARMMSVRVGKVLINIARCGHVLKRLSIAELFV